LEKEILIIEIDLNQQENMTDLYLDLFILKDERYILFPRPLGEG
jgi:hypothetical protein